MSEFLLLAFVFLVAGIVTVPVAARFGLGSVFGYLVAGILVSPVLALLNVDVLSLQHFAEFGIVILLFLIGLDLKPRMIWASWGRFLFLGGGQILATTIVLTGIVILLGQPWPIALAIGTILSLSSTSIVLQTLKEKGLVQGEGGRVSFFVLLSQDVAVVPILALLPLLAMPELVVVSGNDAFAGLDQVPPQGVMAGLAGWQVAVVNVLAIAIVIVGGGYLTRPIFRFVAATRLPELFTATALMLIVGISLLMMLVGLSSVLGSFLAGVVLANSAYRHELEAVIDPFRGLLLGLFFMTVGAGINFALVFENPVAIGGLTLGLIAIKALVLLVLAVIIRLKGLDRWLFALGLAQAGEFGFVLVSAGLASAVLPPVIGDILLLVVALSMLLTPALIWLAFRLSGQDSRETTAWMGEMTVFLSYSRRDATQMETISAFLEDRGFNVKSDTRDLPFGEEWQEELSFMIRQADVVIWLASPDAIKSHWCRWELGEVTRFRKKLVPVVVQDISPDQLPQDVQRLQLLPAQGSFDPKRRDHTAALVQVLGSDAAWIKHYSSLSDRALAWDAAHRDEDRLLSWAELDEAKQWQAARPPMAPEPLPLVLDYIHSSQVTRMQSKIFAEAQG